MRRFAIDIDLLSFRVFTHLRESHPQRLTLNYDFSSNFGIYFKIQSLEPTRLRSLSSGYNSVKHEQVHNMKTHLSKSHQGTFNTTSSLR